MSTKNHGLHLNSYFVVSLFLLHGVNPAIVYGCKILVQETGCLETKLIDVIDIPTDFKGTVYSLGQ